MPPARSYSARLAGETPCISLAHVIIQIEGMVDLQS